jgi:hypothetical protein
VSKPNPNPASQFQLPDLKVPGATSVKLVVTERGTSLTIEGATLIVANSYARRILPNCESINRDPFATTHSYFLSS